MVRSKNLTRKPELFRAPLGLGTMYPLNPPLVGPAYNNTGVQQQSTINNIDHQGARRTPLFQFFQPI